MMEIEHHWSNSIQVVWEEEGGGRGEYQAVRGVVGVVVMGG